MSDKFAFGLFDLDWDVFSQHIEGAIHRVPVLEKTGIKSTVCGPGEGEASLPLDGCASARGLRGGPSSSRQAKGLSSTWAELGPRAPARPLPPPQCEPLLMSPPGLSSLLLSLALGVAICKMG